MFERIGITMRVDRSETGEARDVLAQDWADCLASNLPDVAWLPIPNIGAKAQPFLLQWGVDAIVLSGGNDVGSYPRRDETEAAVCRFAADYDLPILGVCRGLHFLHTFHGGRIQDVPDSHARARTHAVRARNDAARALLGSVTGKVNSFHRQGVLVDDLIVFFEPLMLAPDGVVEAMVHRRDRQMAVQWHPERPLPDPDLARRLFQFFYREL